MLKVFLINPAFDFKKFGRFSRFMQPMPCLGLASIAAVLEKNGIEVEIIDAFALRLEKSKVLSLIKEKNPDIVGISCMTPSAPIVFSLAKDIKEYNENIKIVLGNVHATIFAEEIISNEAVDVIVHGEGEYTMLELVQALSQNKNLSQVKGISFKEQRKTITTDSRALIDDLDSLPYPAWHLLPFKKYGFLPFMDVKKPGLSISGSRGCPYNCVFCSLPNIKGEYRKRDYKNIADEFEYLIDRFSIKQIGFVDPIFPYDREDALKFCREIIRRGLNKRVVWICETRIDRVDKELLKEMRRAGCRRILFGLESGVEELLNNVKKIYSLETIRKNISYAKKEGMQTAGLFMIGLPGETLEMTRKTINFAKEIDLDFAKFAITVPFPGSVLYRDLIKIGKFKRRDWENFITFNPNPENLVCLSENITPEELIDMQCRAHREFYLRPKVILNHLFKVRTISLSNLFHGFVNLILKWKI